MPSEPKSLPEWIDTPVGALSALTEQEQKGLLEIVRDEDNLSRLSTLPKVVGARLGISAEDSIQIVSFLQWFSGRMATDNQFEDWFRAGALASGYGESSVAVIVTLASQVCFRIGAKALDLYLRAPYNTFNAEITSDIRPVWDTTGDYASAPVAVTIMHTLQLQCWGQVNEDSQTIFVTVDAADLTNLIKLAGNALRKQQTLEEMIRVSGLRYVQIGEGNDGGEDED